MKSFKNLLVIIITAFSLNTLAVDGFQDLKFGMTVDEVKKVKKCNWKPYKKIENSWTCDNFKFLGQKTKMLAGFEDGKLYGVQVIVPDNQLETLINTLPEKYEVSTPLKTEIKDGKTVMEVKLDNDTIRLNVTYRGNNEYDYTAILHYVSEDFLNKTNEEKANKKEKIKSEL